MDNKVLEKHIFFKGYNHKWYRESFIFLGTYYSHNMGMNYDLYFGYEIQNKHLQDDHEDYYSNRPMGVAVFGPTDKEIFENSLMTAVCKTWYEKEFFDLIRTRAVTLGLIDVVYLEFNVTHEATKVIKLKKAGWKQMNKDKDGSRVWVLSENTTVDTDTAYDMLILSKLKNNH